MVFGSVILYNSVEHEKINGTLTQELPIFIMYYNMYLYIVHIIYTYKLRKGIHRQIYITL